MKRPAVFRLTGFGILLLFSGLVGIAQQEPQVPESVSTLAARAEQELIKTLKVDELLWPAKNELVTLMKSQPRAAKLWQLEPALARQIKDLDLFRFVVSRANSYLLCSAAFLSEYPLEQLDEAALIKGDVFAREWANTSSGSVWISRDGTFLADSAGRPIRLRTQEDIDHYWKLEQRFAPLARPLLEKKSWDTELFRSNLRYLRLQYGASPNDDPEVAKALGIAPGGAVYPVRLINALVSSSTRRERRSWSLSHR